MLSLIFLPLLFMVMVPTKKQETVLMLSLVSDRPSTSNITFYNTAYLLEKTLGKHIITIDLDDNVTLNARKMLYIEQEAMRINYSYDTSSIIKVSLSENTTYGEFVALVDMMYKNAFKRFSFIGNDFYIFGDTPPTKFTNSIRLFSCGFIPPPDTKPGFIETIKLYFTVGKQIMKENVLLLSLFLLLIIIPTTFKISRMYK